MNVAILWIHHLFFFVIVWVQDCLLLLSHPRPASSSSHARISVCTYLRGSNVSSSCGGTTHWNNLKLSPCVGGHIYVTIAVSRTALSSTHYLIHGIPEITAESDKTTTMCEQENWRVRQQAVKWEATSDYTTSTRKYSYDHLSLNACTKAVYRSRESVEDVEGTCTGRGFRRSQRPVPSATENQPISESARRMTK